MTHLSYDYSLIFTNNDIEILKDFTGRQLGRAEYQDGAWLLVAYPDGDNGSYEVEIGYVHDLQSIIRWINKGAPADWKDSALSR